ncbi:MAG: methyltransferase domain-containing protein [Myxococcaceae bacterium]|nr:methyltransferase domain-containing protein [Myxococcaceae bacterium]
MPGEPWWVERVSRRLLPGALDALDLGGLWRLSEGCRFVRDNVEERLLSSDFERAPGCEAVWRAFLARAAEVHLALETEGAVVAAQRTGGPVGARLFRESWESLGFTVNPQDSGTPADDHLDGLYRLPRHSDGPQVHTDASPNLSSRAERISDFLTVTQPGPKDVVIDLGSGSGKLALTVSASAATRVVGIELGERFVEVARATASSLSLPDVRFVHGDVRDADLSAGTIFFLYHPFRGQVAKDVAAQLGALARRKPIVVYAGGPLDGFGEHFLGQVSAGALALSERRGEFGQVLVLRSA